ncbi:hypothetical protein [Asticcacaulis sp. AND118]|uniref:hypothetical protein n=1 Tax=Asticcacaulis sp. AND118 TaxID=2840468 RepID=UPI001CFFB506|nr:hypothetical protein [Asticcacaulis sp. AND118]UDF05684.1 hypothetical protein LH365_18190 [Asticcacaulis sp. AND118]
MGFLRAGLFATSFMLASVVSVPALAQYAGSEARPVTWCDESGQCTTKNVWDTYVPLTQGHSRLSVTTTTPFQVCLLLTREDHPDLIADQDRCWYVNGKMTLPAVNLPARARFMLLQMDVKNDTRPFVSMEVVMRCGDQRCIQERGWQGKIENVALKAKTDKACARAEEGETLWVDSYRPDPQSGTYQVMIGCAMR